MKQLVPTLKRQHPTPMESAAERRPQCLPSRATVTHHDVMPQGLYHDRSAKQLFEDIPSETNPCDDLSEQLETVQLERLASALLSKDHHDLAALAATNPALIEEWQQAFRAQRSAAERSARYWASAAAVLATVKGLRGSPRNTRSTH